MRHALSGRTRARVRNSLSSIVAGLALSALGGLWPASAQQFASLPETGRKSEAYGPAKPIEAWTRFCTRHEDECQVNVQEAEFVELTPKVWALITSTNRSVNKLIKPTKDLEHWGISDRWSLPRDGKGDCEDYQLLKRKILITHGLPRRAMRMTVVIDEESQGHAVLTVRTDRGDFVLDNKRDAVLSWDRTRYTYVKRESASAVGWVALGGLASPMATANQ